MVGGGGGFRGRFGEGGGEWRVFDGICGPEPAGAPEVHGGFESFPWGCVEEFVAVDAGAFGGVVDGEFVESGEEIEGVCVCGDGFLGAIAGVEEIWPGEETVEIIFEGTGGKFSEGFTAGFFCEVDAVGVRFVAAFAIFPGHDGVVEELVEPCSDESIAAFDFVIEE